MRREFDCLQLDPACGPGCGRHLDAERARRLQITNSNLTAA
jgi:hypothetical protein